MKYPILCLLALLAAVDGHAQSQISVRPARSPEAIVAGHCSRCHGPEGRSSTELFPKLASQNPEYIVKQLFNFKTGQRSSTVMEEVANSLTTEEINALAQYFSRQPVRPDKASNPALVKAGRQLYFNGNPRRGITPCVTCHGETATGAAVLPRLAGQHATYLAAQIRHFIKRSRTNDSTVMHTVVNQMTEAEIRAVAEYLSTVEP